MQLSQDANRHTRFKGLRRFTLDFEYGGWESVCDLADARLVQRYNLTGGKYCRLAP